jgi:hypothetical protein
VPATVLVAVTINRMVKPHWNDRRALLFDQRSLSRAEFDHPASKREWEDNLDVRRTNAFSPSPRNSQNLASHYSLLRA